MATRRTSTRLSQALKGEAPTRSVPAMPDHGENSASTLIEAPQGKAAKRRDPLQAHDFPDGGGSGGAEAFSRKRLGGRKPRGP
jgi:hypothetical protein